MKLFNTQILALFFAGSSLFALPCFAQPEEAAPSEKTSTAPASENATSSKQPEEVVKKGVVASYGRSRQAAAVNAADTSAAGDEQSAVSGSVSRQKEVCSATLMNSGKNSYSISFAVTGVSPRGVQTFRRSYSASLKPGEKITREMRCQKDDNVAVEVLSARKTSK